MKNEIVKASSSLAASLTEVMSIGKAFHESGMFIDIKSAAQAVVKIQAGAEIGIPPFAAMSGIHIIQGKPTIGAGLMASSVKGSGKYDYRVMQQDEKCCSIDFYQGKEKIGNSTFTIEDAKKAQTKNIDKFPRNMLFARALSNGVKWFCPDVFSGPVYVPEEMAEVTEDVKHEEISGPTQPPTIQMPAVPPLQLPACSDKTFGTLLMKIQAAPEDKRPELVAITRATYTLTEAQQEQLKPYEVVPV